MRVDLTKFSLNSKVVAVALSGGSDSMALLCYLQSESKNYGFSVVALNVEHGIRGLESLSDTQFVTSYCEKAGIPLLSYSVNAPKKASEEKLSIEQAARILRYECFFDAINGGKCDVVATAHHLRDNLESVLINLFRGTGLKGVCGIKHDYKNKIIRPFLGVSKTEIEEYIKENSIPFVNDSTNFSDQYTRNAVRLNVLPSIKQIFPEVEKSVLRFCEIASEDDAYLEEQAQKILHLDDDKAQIDLPAHNALLSRACVKALNALGVEKDWEKVHLDSVKALCVGQNGNRIDLPCNITAVKEYDKITFYKGFSPVLDQFEFGVGDFVFGSQNYSVKKVDIPENLKGGFYIDQDKVPKSAVIRIRKDGDKIKKFGGGTKSLNDFYTDLKLPLYKRDCLPVLADGNDVLAIFGVAISDKIKVDSSTKTCLQLK